MKTEPSDAMGRAVQQRFVVPDSAPFLEIRTTLHSALPYAEHFHSAFSVGLILQGETCFSLDGNEHTAEEGDIVLIAPGQTHSCNPVEGCARSYHMLLIDAAWFQEHVAPALEMPGGLRPCVPVVKDAALFSAAVAMVEALVAAREAAAALPCLFRRLQERHGCFVAAGKEPRSALFPSEDFAWPCLAAGGETPPAISRLAQAAGIRRESFSRAVRRKTGLPPSRYLHCLRLEQARRMLRQGKSIAEAALAAGYADQSHFHRMFLRFYSATPGCYRKEMSHLYKK